MSKYTVHIGMFLGQSMSWVSLLRYHHLVFLLFERQISQDLSLTGIDPSAKIRKVLLDAFHMG